MTSKKEVVSKKGKTKQSSGIKFATTNFRLKGSDWLVLPLGVLSFACIYAFAATLPSHTYLTFSNPTVTSLLVGIFSVIYVYKVLRATPRYSLANVIGYIFAVAFIALVGILIATSGNECGGDCNTSSALITWLVVFNPIVASLWSPLAIVGIILLLIKRSK